MHLFSYRLFLRCNASLAALLIVYLLPLCNSILYLIDHYFKIQGVDLRQYSRQIEGDLHEVENASILDCILRF